MQPLRNALQNSCSTSLLKKQLNHTYEKLYRSIFYNRSWTTILCLDSVFQTVKVISQGSWSPEVPGFPRVQRSWGSRRSMGSWGTEDPEGREGLGGPRGPGGPWGPRVPLFYHAINVEVNWITRAIRRKVY